LEIPQSISYIDSLIKAKENEAMPTLLQNELLKELAPCYSESDTQHEINFEVPANIKFFEGHFPKSPILPAFAIIEISMALGRQLKILPEELKKSFERKIFSCH
jgi:3-hydroxymyristoyl/3-hydroxydecanoyl-(acyl carrier protein) dehydratase